MEPPSNPLGQRSNKGCPPERAQMHVDGLPSKINRHPVSVVEALRQRARSMRKKSMHTDSLHRRSRMQPRVVLISP